MERKFTHGTIYGYMKMKCKCGLCAAKKVEVNNARNEKRRSGAGYKQTVDCGTRLSYTRGCRCILCTEDNTTYARSKRYGLEVDTKKSHVN